ncbi:hypothetical protein INR49_022480 [Caranx melampygus]|nr:hypothetical protein INR49_022480 [Caranx melampygus]
MRSTGTSWPPMSTSCGGVTKPHPARDTTGSSQTQRDVDPAPDHQWKAVGSGLYVYSVLTNQWWPTGRSLTTPTSYTPCCCLTVS